MGLERPEFVFPKAFYFSKPCLKFGERLSSQAIHPNPCVVVDGAFLDESSPSQNPKMAAHRRGAQIRSQGQLTGRTRASTKKIDHLAPCGVGQGNQGLIQIAHSLPIHCSLEL